MKPIAPPDYVADGLLTNTVAQRNSSLRNRASQCSNSAHVFWCEFGRVMRHSSWHACSFGSVAAILLLSAYVQMFGIDAGRIVAVVQNVQAVRYWADVMFVRKAVGIHETPINYQVPVSVGVQRSIPYPATLGLRDFGSESHKWTDSRTRFGGTGIRTVAPDVRRLPVEGLSARDALTFDHNIILAYARKPS